MPFERIETAVVEGAADLAIPIAVTEERATRFDFTETLLMTGGSLFVRKGEAIPTDLVALAGKVVVTARTGPLAAFVVKAAGGEAHRGR